MQQLWTGEEMVPSLCRGILLKCLQDTFAMRKSEVSGARNEIGEAVQNSPDVLCIEAEVLAFQERRQETNELLALQRLGSNSICPGF